LQLRLAPDEPDAVVLEFQRLMTRQPNIMNQAGLVREIALWEAVTSANPQSLAAAEQLAHLHESHADQTGAVADRKASADAWLRAGAIALDRGEIRYTYQVSRALVAARDSSRLDEFFIHCLDVAGRDDPSAAYLPLVDYADGLAALGRPDARDYYRRAYELHVNEEGLNKYVIYLLDRREPAEALALIEALPDDARRMNMVIVPLWRRALQQAGRDTRPADAALAEMEQRFRGAQGGVLVGPTGRE
jgi:hypothetical protein